MKTVMKMTRSGERFISSFEFRVSSFEFAILTLDLGRKAQFSPAFEFAGATERETRNPKIETLFTVVHLSCDRLTLVHRLKSAEIRRCRETPPRAQSLRVGRKHA